jgi:hypothetical protein
MTQSEDGAGPAGVPVTAGACGICCEVCPLFIATREDPERLPALAARLGCSVEETRCMGCRTGDCSPFCRDCDLRSCAEERGFDFCMQCSEYPCTELQDFQRERPHRSEIFQHLERIAQVGADAWAAEVKTRYSCPECGTLNGWYALECRRCGRQPGNAFVADHQEAIGEFMSRT